MAQKKTPPMPPQKNSPMRDIAEGMKKGSAPAPKKGKGR